MTLTLVKKIRRIDQQVTIHKVMNAEKEIKQHLSNNIVTLQGNYYFEKQSEDLKIF